MQIFTNWGEFYIGQEVALSDEAKQNDSYSNYFDSVLIIESYDEEDEGLGEKEPIFSFALKNGEEFPFSLYGYEINSID